MGEGKKSVTFLSRLVVVLVSFKHCVRIERSAVDMLVSETLQAASYCVGMFSLGHKLVIFVALRRGKAKLQGLQKVKITKPFFFFRNRHRNTVHQNNKSSFTENIRSCFPAFYQVLCTYICLAGRGIDKHVRHLQICFVCCCSSASERFCTVEFSWAERRTVITVWRFILCIK